MKSNWILALALTAVSAMAADSFARIDAVPRNDKPMVKISPVNTDTVTPQHPDWMKKEPERAAARLTYQDKKPRTDEWKTYVLSFKAEETGTVDIQFGGGYAGDVTKRNWVYVRNVKVNGVSWKNNGDFKKYSYVEKGKKDMPSGFWVNRKGELIKDLGDGKTAVHANHDNRLSFSFNVVEGETYEVSVDFKAAPTPAP